MAKYLMIASRDPFEYGDAPYFHDQARALAGKGNDVTLFLLQNAVFTARKGVDNNPIAKLADKNSRVKVLADEFCLKERGIKREALLPGVTVSNVDQLVDLLAQDGVKAVWH